MPTDVDISTLGSVIKSAYEAEADTNAFTDAEQTKLSGIEANATADQTGAEIKSAYEAEADTNAFTDADETKLDGIETAATADQSDAEIETAYNNRVDTVSQGEAEGGVATVVKRWTSERVRQAIEAFTEAFTSSDRTKLDGIETAATADQSDVEIEAAYNNQVAEVSQGDAEAGTSTDVYRWTPERVSQAIAALAAGGGGGLAAKYKTGTYTAVASDVIFADTSGGAFTITLPASPTAEDSVSIFDVGNASVENITIDRNSETIDGVAQDFVIDENHGQVQLIYTGSDWEVAIITPGSGLTEAQVVDVTSGIERYQWYAEEMGVFGGSTKSTCYAGRFTCISLGPAGFEQSKIPFKFPKKWDKGQLRFRAFYVPSNTDTGDAQYVFVTDALAHGEDFAFETTLTSTITETQSGTIDRLHVGAWSSWIQPGGSPDDDHYTLIRMQRQGDGGGDTFTGDMDVVCIEMEYTTEAPTDD